MMRTSNKRVEGGWFDTQWHGASFKMFLFGSQINFCFFTPFLKLMFVTSLPMLAHCNSSAGPTEFLVYRIERLGSWSEETDQLFIRNRPTFKYVFFLHKTFFDNMLSNGRFYLELISRSPARFSSSSHPWLPARPFVWGIIGIYYTEHNTESRRFYLGVAFVLGTRTVFFLTLTLSAG